ncbi:MAG TPA: hypothetical protein VK188_19505 [Holophaga sp.]|nr:hypothetical protein [Holophaga sp.]
MNRASDIPVFISLLDCLAPVGREGDTTSELVFDQLKATVPLEYEAPTAAQWAADPAARARVMKLYRDWWAAHGPAVAFAPGPGMFFPVSMGDPERRAAARVHNAWYIASH